MQVITDLVKNIQLIAVAIVLLLLAFTGIGIYLLRIKKKVVVEKNVDYSQFQRKDIMEYVPICDVTEDMLVSDGGKRFIGAIKCQGFSFGDAEVEEKLQTIRGYITFFNVQTICQKRKLGQFDPGLSRTDEPYSGKEISVEFGLSGIKGRV